MVKMVEDMKFEKLKVERTKKKANQIKPLSSSFEKRLKEIEKQAWRDMFKDIDDDEVISFKDLER